MKKWLKNPFVIVLVIAVVLALIYSSQYNKLISLDTLVKQQWGNVEVQLQRRADLVPNLVNTVKGYAAHESSVLEAVTAARARVGQATTVDDKMAANNDLSGALSRLLVVTENYPDLKANQNFLDLQAELEGTENRIAQERRKYNETVMNYNRAIRGFPGVLIAKTLGFQERKSFESDERAKTVPEVKF